MLFDSTRPKCPRFSVLEAGHNSEAEERLSRPQRYKNLCPILLPLHLHPTSPPFTHSTTAKRTNQNQSHTAVFCRKQMRTPQEPCQHTQIVKGLRSRDKRPKRNGKGSFWKLKTAEKPHHTLHRSFLVLRPGSNTLTLEDTRLRLGMQLLTPKNTVETGCSTSASFV